MLPSNRSIHVHACRAHGILPTVNEHHEARGGGQDPLPFPFLVPRTGNRQQRIELKRRRNERVGTGPLLIRVTEARARLLGHYYADDYPRERERKNRLAFSSFSCRVKRKVITIVNHIIRDASSLFSLFLFYFGHFLSCPLNGCI